jgi:hypothetical protein
MGMMREQSDATLWEVCACLEEWTWTEGAQKHAYSVYKRTMDVLPKLQAMLDAAIAQSDAEPVAWQLVPKEPTEHQYEAMKVLAECMLEAVNKIDVSLLYKTGLQAAPPRPDAPGRTDLMVCPETLDAFMEANPLPSDAPAELIEAAEWQCPNCICAICTEIRSRAADRSGK